MILSIKEIEKLITKEHIPTNTKKVLEIFLLSINDWPNTVDNLNDYELKIQRFINNTTTKSNIKSVLNNIDFSKYAWQAESLYELLEIYNYFDENVSLKEIISNVSTCYGE